MAYIFVLILTFFSSLTHSAVIVTPAFDYSFNGTSYGSDYVAYCTAHAQSLGHTFVSATITNPSNGTVQCTRARPSDGNQYTILYTPSQTCPNGGSLNQGSCYYPDCSQGETFNTTTYACEGNNPCQELNGENIGKASYSGDSSTSSGCFGGCSADFVGDTLCLADGYCTSFKTVLNGQSCSPDEPLPTTPQEQCVNDGYSYYEINGVVTCAPVGSDGSTPAEQTTYDISTTTNDNSVTTTNTTTVNNGDTVTTTTTTTVTPINGDPPVITTETKEQDKRGFCEENPNAKICESDDGRFSGSCGASFNCEGDAVQCAIAKEQHIRNCALFETETALSQLGNDVTQQGDLGDSDHPYRTENRDTINLSTDLDSSNPYPTTGMQDLNISVGGHAVTLPFSNLNTGLEWLGYLLLAFTAYGCYLIVGRG